MNSTNVNQYDEIEIGISDPIDYDATLELFNCFYCNKMDTRRAGERRAYCYTCASKEGVTKNVAQKQSRQIKCECGAHKTSSPNLHSDWCPLA